jgi:hypothetical protein
MNDFLLGLNFDPDKQDRYLSFLCEIVLAIARIALGRGSASAAEERAHIKAIRLTTAKIRRNGMLGSATSGCSGSGSTGTRVEV